MGRVGGDGRPRKWRESKMKSGSIDFNVECKIVLNTGEMYLSGIETMCFVLFKVEFSPYFHHDHFSCIPT